MERLNTLFVGRTLHDLQELASTNEYALALLSKSNPPEGTVISTPCQTDGRGQIGSKWESEPGKNINLSIILYPDFLEVRQQFRLSQAISLAVCDFVKNYLPSFQVAIKWPNDIYVANLKIAGILIQNTLMNNCIRASVAGIGININQTEFLSHPPNPTSLTLQTGRVYDLRELVPALCHFVETRYLQLKSGKMVFLQGDYLRCLYRFGEPCAYQRANGEVFHGAISGLEESGKLKLSVNGREEVFGLKELKFL